MSVVICTVLSDHLQWLWRGVCWWSGLSQHLSLILFYFFPTVDKNKSKAGSHQQHPQQQASQQNQSTRPQDAVPASLTEVDRINQNVQQLKGLLRASNCRFEALSIVLQQTLTGVRIDLFHKNTFICSLKYILWHVWLVLRHGTH